MAYAGMPASSQSRSVLLTLTRGPGVRHGDASPICAGYQVEADSRRRGVISRTTGTAYAWMIGRVREVVATRVMALSFSGARCGAGDARCGPPGVRSRGEVGSARRS